MKKLSLFTFLFFVASTTLLMAENNETKEVDTNQTVVAENNQSVEETNSSKNTDTDITKQQVEEQMKREEKYAKEQKFYQGDEYDLTSSEVNKKSLNKLELIEPDFDFNMDDVYRDDI